MSGAYNTGNLDGGVGKHVPASCFARAAPGWRRTIECYLQTGRA
jgi:hypothetical protein